VTAAMLKTHRFVPPVQSIGNFFSRPTVAGDLGGGHDRRRRADCKQSQQDRNMMA
jgi:hypothetical protein